MHRFKPAPSCTYTKESVSQEQQQSGAEQSHRVGRSDVVRVTGGSIARQLAVDRRSSGDTTHEFNSWHKKQQSNAYT